MRKSCVIYATWADQIINMPSELAGEYIQAILKYAIYGEDTIPDNQLLNAMLIPVKKKLDEDLEKYQEKVNRMSSCRNQKDINKKSDRNLQDIKSVTDTDTVTVTDTVKKNKKKASFHNFPEREYDFSELGVKNNV